MGQTLLQLGPQDHGRPMALDEFDLAEGAEGHLYELGRAKIVVTDVPDPAHFDQVFALKDQLFAFHHTHPGVIQRIGTGSECKLLIDELGSERHPDLLLYKTPRPRHKDVWRLWAPEIVVEVVSRSSAHRDYEEKPEEYLRFGVAENWIFDIDKGDAGELLALTRAADRWQPRIIRPGETYATPLLPGFTLDLAAVFAAAR